MKALILKISLAVALSFGVTVGFAQQQGAAQTKNNEQETKVESVVVMKKAMTEEEVKAPNALAAVWFQYLSGPYDDPNSYSFLTSSDGEAATECEEGSEEICAIKVEQDMSTGQPEPNALLTFQGQITAALAAGDHTTNVRLRDEEPNN